MTNAIPRICKNCRNWATDAKRAIPGKSGMCLVSWGEDSAEVYSQADEECRWSHGGFWRKNSLVAVPVEDKKRGMNLAKITQALDWAKSIQLKAPVSPHHQIAVNELWSMVEPLGVKTALEVGAGEPPGLIVTMLREHGVDAKSLDSLSDCDVPGDMHDLPFEDNSFDLVCARHALEHVLIPYVALAEMARVSRQYLLVVVPWDSPKTLDWPDHLNVYSKGGWELIFKRLGLRIVEMDCGNHTEPYRRGIELDMEFRYCLSKESKS